MPTKADIDGFSERITIKAWMPTFVGITMTGWVLCLNPKF
jgi:hypothetical protein